MEIGFLRLFYCSGGALTLADARIYRLFPVTQDGHLRAREKSPLSKNSMNADVRNRDTSLKK